MKIVVVGGGITGQLVQFGIPDAEVFDWGKMPEKRLTRSWGANYLWEPLPGLECKPFKVVTHIDGAPATVDSIFAYKLKVGKTNESRLNWSKQFQDTMMGWDFATPIPANIRYDKRAVKILPDRGRVEWEDGQSTEYDWLVSTIPLYALLSLMRGSQIGDQIGSWVVGKFRSSPIFVKVTPRPPDAIFPPEVLYVNYLSSTQIQAYRYCDRNGERHYEGLNNMGSIPNKRIVPGKIHDLDPSLFHRIHTALREHNIMCFGRFARWQSDELVHETFRDILTFRHEVFK